jgi:hypothetical protein
LNPRFRHRVSANIRPNLLNARLDGRALITGCTGNDHCRTCQTNVNITLDRQEN